MAANEPAQGAICREQVACFASNSFQYRIRSKRAESAKVLSSTFISYTPAPADT